MTANVEQLRQTPAVRYINRFIFAGSLRLLSSPGGACIAGMRFKLTLAEVSAILVAIG